MPPSRSRLIPCLLLAACSASWATAADHAALEPYLTSDVVAIGYLDVPKFDVARLLEEMRRLGASDEILDEAESGAAGVQQIYDQLASLGVGRAYVVVSLDDIQFQGSPWVIEVGADGQPDAVVDLLRKIFGGRPGEPERGAVWFAPTRFETDNGHVLAAMSDEQMKRLKAPKSDAVRGDALEALATLGSADLGAIVFGNADSRRVVREMFPQAPAPFQDINGELIADELRWGGVTLKLPPASAVRLTIETTGSDVAELLGQSAIKALELAKALLVAGAAQSTAEAPLEDAQLAQGLALLEPEVDGARLTISFGDDASHQALVRDVLFAPLMSARAAARRATRMNSFKQLALAFHNYHDREKTFPPHANYDDQGRPLLSWRVHILPYLDQGELYKQFRLDEPWDSDHNRTLIDQMPWPYADPDQAMRREAGRTTYLVPYGEGLAFEGREGVTLRDFTDGTSNTILVVEATPERAVVWTKPDDWEVDLDQPTRGVKRDDREGFVAARVDGSAHFILNDVDPTVLRALLTRAGGEVISY